MLMAYVSLLIRDQQTDLVASYVSQLPSDLATVQYASFLETINKPELRPRCLELATEAGQTYSSKEVQGKMIQMYYLLFFCLGLDVTAITKLVVETVRERDETEFTHHNQTLESGTTKVFSPSY